LVEKKTEEEIFACKECGQVYYIKPPKKCLRISCKSINFKRITENDVLNMHDFGKYIIKTCIKKFIGLFTGWNEDL